MFNFSVVFAVKLASRYICFKYLDCVKRIIFPISFPEHARSRVSGGHSSGETTFSRDDFVWLTHAL